MKVIIKIGDLFQVVLSDGSKVFFQYIGKDSCDMNTGVIRIFKHRYQQNATPSIDEIIRDDVVYYLHTFIRGGLKYGLWTKYGSSKEIGTNEIWFKDSYDYGNYPGQKIVSYDWVVWKFNGHRTDVGALPSRYFQANIGLVFDPFNVLEMIESGSFDLKYYPVF